MKTFLPGCWDASNVNSSTSVLFCERAVELVIVTLKLEYLFLLLIFVRSSRTPTIKIIENVPAATTWGYIFVLILVQV